jgi:uncharacterized membrane protein
MKLNIAILVILAGLALGSCKTKYVSVPEIHTEYITRVDTTVIMDSVYQRDSVYVERKGDTLYVNKTLYRDRYHNIYKVKKDTVVKRDSVNVAYPVEKEMSRSERLFVAIGKFFAALVIALLFVIGVKQYKRH